MNSMNLPGLGLSAATMCTYCHENTIYEENKNILHLSPINAYYNNYLTNTNISDHFIK